MNARIIFIIIFSLIIGTVLPQFLLAESVDVNIDALVLGCGDEIIQSPEECDSSNLDGQTCANKGFSSGTLSCSVSCLFNTSGCTSSSPATLGSGGVPTITRLFNVVVVTPIDNFIDNVVISPLVSTINNGVSVINSFINRSQNTDSNVNIPITQEQKKESPALFDISIEPIEPKQSTNVFGRALIKIKNSLFNFITGTFNVKIFSRIFFWW